jgi:hypothetical protein
MNDPEFAARFCVIEVSLVIAPLFAYLGANARRWFGRAISWAILTLLILLAGWALMVWFSPWSLRTGLANSILGSAGYMAMSFVSFAASSLVPDRRARRAAFILLGVPFVIGLLGGTGGVIGVGLSIRDDIDCKHIPITPRYGCNITYSPSGYGEPASAQVEIVYYPKSIPVQKRVWGRVLDSRQYDYENQLAVKLRDDGHHAVISVVNQNGGEETQSIDLR